jgi:putative Mn2+ efflux pump MntP
MILPPIPNFITFLLLIFLGFVSVVLGFHYYNKAYRYKKELDTLKLRIHMLGLENIFTNPQISASIKTTTNTVSRGEDKTTTKP